MIECDHCKDWFHAACITYDESEDYSCASCRALIGKSLKASSIKSEPIIGQFVSPKEPINDLEKFHRENDISIDPNQVEQRRTPNSAISPDIITGSPDTEILVDMSENKRAGEDFDKRVAKRPKVKDMGRVDKLRRMGKKGFESTFTFIFEKILSEKDQFGYPLDDTMDFANPNKYALFLEEKLFDAYSLDGEPTDQVFFY